MSNVKDPIETLDAFIEYASKTKKYHDVGDYVMIKSRLKHSTPNAKIQELIDKYDGMCDLHFLELLDGLKQLIEGE